MTFQAAGFVTYTALAANDILTLKVSSANAL